MQCDVWLTSMQWLGFAGIEDLSHLDYFFANQSRTVKAITNHQWQCFWTNVDNAAYNVRKNKLLWMSFHNLFQRITMTYWTNRTDKLIL